MFSALLRYYWYYHSNSDFSQDPQASFDLNDNDTDPTPRYDKADENRSV